MAPKIKKKGSNNVAAVNNDPYVQTNNIKRYDIFKNTVTDDEIENINELLANLSVADTSHDIDKKDKGIPGITGFLQAANNIHAKMYKKGIPVPYTGSILGEDEAVGSVIDRSTFTWMSPVAGTNVPQEHIELFKRYQYVPLRVMKYIKEGRTPTNDPTVVNSTYSDPTPAYVRSDGQKHTIDTVNGNKYVVTYFDVKPEKNGKKGEIINAKTFFGHMGYTEAMNGVGEKNIAFVVDCTSVKIEDILNKGTRINDNFRTYLIKSPEGENDPGGKTNLQSTTFQSATGVRYRAAVPHNLNKSKSYSYSFEDINTSPYTQFFTNYNFELSELQFDDKYIFSDLTTKLNIIDPNKIVPPKPVLNSGDMNEIGAVSTVIRNIMAKIVSYGNKASAIDIFEYNCALQQKRSGDWLQALLCCLVASGQRKFCEYNSPVFTFGNLFKKKEIRDGVTNTALTFDPSDVYLVTHDRILLAFALLLGINVIFTHHFPGSRGYSYHSALVYKIENPLERSQSKIAVMTEFHTGVRGVPETTFYRQLNTSHTQLNNIYSEFNNWINRFKSGTPIIRQNGNIPTTDDNLEQHITEFTRRIHNIPPNEGNNNIRQPISADEINNFTQKIFALAFKIALIKSTFPDLDNLQAELDEIQTLRDKFGNPDNSNGNSIRNKIAAQIGNALNPPQAVEDQANTENDDNYFLKYQIYADNNSVDDDDNNPNPTKISYKEIVKKLSQYHAINSKTKKFNKIRENYDTFMDTLTNNLKKNPTFGLILAWRTTNVPKCNLWVQYNNVLAIDSAYINDKNIFLYELTKLDDDSKDKICSVYYKLFEAIKIPANVAGTSSLQAKTQQNVLSFCLEVFINLGPFVQDDAPNNTTTRTNIRTAIDTFLAAANTGPDAPPEEVRVVEAANVQVVPAQVVPAQVVPAQVVPASGVRNDSTNQINAFKPNRFNEVIAELNALNAITKYDENVNSTIIRNIIKTDIKIPTTDNPEPVTPYNPILTPIVIEELIEMKANNVQGNVDSQDVTGQSALLGLDVREENSESQNPTINLNDIQIPQGNNLGIANVPFQNVDDQAFNAQAGGGQVGGRSRDQDISFIFDNKLAPRYLAVTNLFKPSLFNLGTGNLETIYCQVNK